MPKQILFYKPGSLTAKDREKFTRAGFLTCETNDFEAFRLVDPMVPHDRALILKAAVWAITTHGGTQEGPKTLFGKKLAELLNEALK